MNCLVCIFLVQRLTLGRTESLRGKGCWTNLTSSRQFGGMMLTSRVEVLTLSFDRLCRSSACFDRLDQNSPWDQVNIPTPQTAWGGGREAVNLVLRHVSIVSTVKNVLDSNKICFNGLDRKRVLDFARIKRDISAGGGAISRMVKMQNGSKSRKTEKILTFTD